MMWKNSQEFGCYVRDYKLLVRRSAVIKYAYLLLILCECPFTL